MSVCICGPTALELYRNRGRMAHELLDAPRTGSLSGCVIPSGTDLEDVVRMTGVHEPPFHFMVPIQHHPRNMDAVVRHVRSGPYTLSSFIKLPGDVLVTSPELTLYELAQEFKRDRLASLDVVELAIVAFQLCGTYLLDTDEQAWSGFTNTARPLAKMARVRRLLDRLEGARGVRKVRAALELSLDGSNSPMETVLAALLTFPRRVGGVGLGPAVMNYVVETPSGPKWIDVAFPEHKVGVEYKGRDPHSVEKTGRDDRRQNKLHGSGWTIINVWYEDIADPNLFGDLIGDVTRAMGVRLRIRDDRFTSRQSLLRAKLIPAFKRYARVS